MPPFPPTRKQLATEYPPFGEKKRVPPPCKPDSVHPILRRGWTVISLTRTKAQAPHSRGMRLIPGSLTGGPPFPCYVLHHPGFSLPLRSPSARWALTPPFQPYLCRPAPPEEFYTLALAQANRTTIGGIFSAALSIHSPLGSRPLLSQGGLPYGVRTFLNRSSRPIATARETAPPFISQKTPDWKPKLTPPKTHPQKTTQSSKPPPPA